MRKTLVASISLVALLAVFASGNAGQATSKAWQGGATKAVLAANAGHRPIGRLPSGGVQTAIEEAAGLYSHGTVSAPAFPPSQRTVGCSNTYSATGFPDNVRANQICDYRRQAEVTIANNPAQVKNFAIGQNDSRLGYNRQGVDYTFDNGAHFGDYQPPTTQTNTSVCINVSCQWTFDAVSDPAIAWGKDGQMYYALLGFDFLNDGFTGLWVAKSNSGEKGSYLHSPGDPGDTSTVNPVGLVHDNFADPTQSDDKEFLAVDTTDGPFTGNVYMVWTIFDFSCEGGTYCASPIFFSRSDDGGLTWNGGGIGTPGPPKEISGNNPDICILVDLFDPGRDAADCDYDQGAWPVVGSDGSSNVVFNNCSTSEEAAEGLPAVCQQLFVRSVDGGTTWTDPVKVADDYATEPLNGISGNIGNGCPLFRQCLPPNGYRMNNFPSMGVDMGNGSDATSGKLAVFWSDFRNGHFTVDENGNVVCNPCNEDVFSSVSYDDGVSWEAAHQVTTKASAQYFPWGDVDENGNLYVGYYTRQYGSCETDGCLDFRLSSSSNDGLTWSTQRITTSSMPNLTDVTNPIQQGFIGDYNGLSAAGTNVYMTWADTRGLNGVIEEDAYFAKVPQL